jgi:hypothetical protein
MADNFLCFYILYNIQRKQAQEGFLLGLFSFIMINKIADILMKTYQEHLLKL